MSTDRRRRSATPAVLLALVLCGCSSTASGGDLEDPAVGTAVADAIAASASAQLGLEQDADGRIFPTTLSVLLGDMAQVLADTTRTLELHEPSDADGEVERDEALTQVRAASEAVHAALAGDHETALAELDEAIDALEGLGDE